MKIIFLALIIVSTTITLAVYGLKYWHEVSLMQGQPPIVIQSTITGVLTPVASTGAYSDIIVVGNHTIGVTSNTINLKNYENKNVKVIGEFSGSTMYADSITVVP